MALRKCFLIMLPLHVFLLITLDLYVYDIEIMAIIAEIMLVYLDYQNYMSLNKMFMLAEIALMTMSSFVALTHFERVFFAEEFSWFVLLSYISQYFVIQPFCIIFTVRKIQAH